MKTIIDEKSLYKMLSNSNLKFFSSGVLHVADPLFITHWSINQEEFVSNIFYSSLDNESFSTPFKKESLPKSWSMFGIKQDLGNNSKLNAPYHRNKHIELHYVKEGTFNIKINRTIHTLNKGDVCIINPNCYHSDLINQDDLDLFIIGINREITHASEIDFSKYDLINSSFSANKKKSEYIIFRDVVGIEDVLHVLVENIKSDNFKTLSKFLDKLYANDYDLVVEHETSRNSILFEEINNFIMSNYQTVTLEDLQFYFNFSKEHISRIIKKETGLTFCKYVQKIKLDESIYLLRTTNYSIKVIMRSIGYSNETHFYNLFEDYTGVLPQKYRKAKRQLK
ncbi:helix-turn-helix domain-containing protein [Paenibacillus yanchengensis]|uniref:Helix-turn-helix domain-containing protein n=1 Tax=Paenibacillus yanchengensis TaxID=2035833 RepID=A0ABW4YR96_9BACL